MKRLKRLLLLMSVAIITSGSIIMAQTIQLYPTAQVDGWALCLNRQVTGYMTYHLTYHLDKKTGKAVWSHLNVHKAELWDSEEPDKRYILIDTGAKTSLAGDTWDWYNNLDSPGWDYDIDDPNIPFIDETEKGVNIWATFKWISPGGEKYTMRGVTVVHINAKGESTADFYKGFEDCNY